MVLVALTSFILGAFLRFGLDITSGNVDVLVGVILPLLLLWGLEWTRRGNTDPGWVAVENQRLSLSKIFEEETQGPYDSFPAKVVIVSLIVCALTMFLLAVLSSSGRMIIGTFGISLLLIAGGVHVQMRRMLTQHHTQQEKQKTL